MAIPQFRDEALAAIVSTHEAGGLSYPRPAGECFQCKGKIILCWGDKIKPHYRHVKNVKCTNTSLGESDIHLFAKDILYVYLNSGNKILFNSACAQCERQYYTLTPDIHEAEVEVPYSNADGKKCIFDVACLDEKKEPIFGIEVLATHRTTGLLARQDVTWVEVKACEVIAKLSQSNGINPPIIRNVRYCAKCSHVMCIFMPVLARELGYKNTLTNYSSPARRLVDAAVTGSYIVANEVWCLKSEVCQNKLKEIYASEFIRRQKCLRCHVKTKTNLIKPYCKKCLRRIIDERDIPKYRKTVSEGLKHRLRFLLHWIDNLPDNWKQDVKCSFCQRDYISTEENYLFRRYWEPGHQYISTKLWWFGKEKRCCTVCLEAQ